MRPLTRRERIIAVTCGLVCLAWVARTVLVTGVAEYGAGLEDRLRVTAGKIARARAEIAREPAYDRRLAVLAQAYGTADSEGAETSSISSRIDALAKKSGIRIVNVQPGKFRQEAHYSEFPVEVVLDGEWRNIVRFIAGISAPEEHMEVRALRLEKYSDGIAALRGRMVVIRFRLR